MAVKVICATTSTKITHGWTFLALVGREEVGCAIDSGGGGPWMIKWGRR